MIVRLGTAPRREGLTFEQFQRHWRTSHADVVSALPGLRCYQQFHAVLEDGEPLLAYPGFDACSALRFDSAAAMDAAFTSEEFLQAVQEDEAEFVDKTRFRGLIGRWHPDGDADLGTTGPVHVLTLIRTDEGSTPQALATRLAGVPTAGIGGSLVADHPAHEGRFPAMADVVRVVTYADTDEALAGAEATRRAVDPAGIIGEHLCRTVDVPLGVEANDERTQP